MTHTVDLVPGKSLRILLVNCLLLMRAGLSKHRAMAGALNVAGYRPRQGALNRNTHTSTEEPTELKGGD